MDNMLWYHTICTNTHSWWITKELFERNEAYCVESEYFQRLLLLPEMEFQRKVLKFSLPDSIYWMSSRFFALYLAKHYVEKNPLAKLVYLRHALGPLWLWHVRAEEEDMQWWSMQMDLVHPLYHWLTVSKLPASSYTEETLQYLNLTWIIESTKKLWTSGSKSKHHNTYWWMGHLPVLYAKYPHLMNDKNHQQMMYCAYRMLHAKADIYHWDYSTFGDAVHELLRVTGKKRLRDLLSHIRIGHTVLSPAQIWDSLLRVKTGIPWMKRIGSQESDPSV